MKKSEPTKKAATRSVKKDVKVAGPARKKVQTGEKKGVPLGRGTGRRKTAVARIWLRRGSGKLVVNGIDYATYFDTDVSKNDVTRPFRVIPVSSNYDVEANVFGGGKHAQAGAIKLGIARALVTLDEKAKPLLRKHGLLTVDSRQKERKKYGQRGARRKFQFVKR